VVDDTVVEREGAQAGPFFTVGWPVRSDAGRDRSDEEILVGLPQPIDADECGPSQRSGDSRDANQAALWIGEVADNEATG
jgi:hypothetical protein